MILAGDIGGTNTRLALFDSGGAKLTPIGMEVFPSRAHSGPEEIVRRFLAKHNLPVEAASFGIAGPVQHGHCRTPNLPWNVDSTALAEASGLPAVDLINDLEANAQGILTLGAEDFSALYAGAGFLKAFTAKGRASELLESIPVCVILNDKAALLGAGRVAALSRSRR